MSEFISNLEKIYEDEKDLPEQPSYLGLIKEILETDRRLKLRNG